MAPAFAMSSCVSTVPRCVICVASSLSCVAAPGSGADAVRARCAGMGAAGAKPEIDAFASSSLPACTGFVHAAAICVNSFGLKVGSIALMR